MNRGFARMKSFKIIILILLISIIISNSVVAISTDNNKTNETKIVKITKDIKEDVEKTIQSREEAKLNVKERLELLKKQKEISHQKHNTTTEAITREEYIRESNEQIKFILGINKFIGQNSEMIKNNLLELNKSINNIPEITNKKRSFFEKIFSSKHVLNKEINIYFTKNNALIKNINELINKSDCDESIKKYMIKETKELNEIQEQYLLKLHEAKKNNKIELFSWLETVCGKLGTVDGEQKTVDRERNTDI